MVHAGPVVARSAPTACARTEPSRTSRVAALTVPLCWADRRNDLVTGTGAHRARSHTLWSAAGRHFPRSCPDRCAGRRNGPDEMPRSERSGCAHAVNDRFSHTLERNSTACPQVGQSCSVVVSGRTDTWLPPLRKIQAGGETSCSRLRSQQRWLSLTTTDPWSR